MTAKQLARWRKARHWTQKQAALWWGCTTRQWQRYEYGENLIPEPLALRANNPGHDADLLVEPERAAS